MSKRKMGTVFLHTYFEKVNFIIMRPAKCAINIIRNSRKSFTDFLGIAANHSKISYFVIQRILQKTTIVTKQKAFCLEQEAGIPACIESGIPAPCSRKKNLFKRFFWKISIGLIVKNVLN